MYDMFSWILAFVIRFSYLSLSSSTNSRNYAQQAITLWSGQHWSIPLKNHCPNNSNKWAIITVFSLVTYSSQYIITCYQTSSELRTDLSSSERFFFSFSSFWEIDKHKREPVVTRSQTLKLFCFNVFSSKARHTTVENTETPKAAPFGDEWR